MKMDRRTFIKSAAIGAGSLTLSGSAAAQETSAKPNFVFICSDQQHGSALGFKDSFFQTPNLDRLAGEGVVFDNAFCTTPQCSASRSSLMTGLFPHKTGVLGNIGSGMGDVKELSQKTIGAYLQDAGYRTAYYGKWHLGEDETGCAGWDARAIDRSDSETTRKGLEYLVSGPNDPKPFALFLMYMDPHDVYHFKPGTKDVSDLNVPLPQSWEEQDFATKPVVQKQFMTEDQGRKIWGMERKVWEEYRDFYRSKVGLIDDAVGNILGALKSKGLEEETIVVFTSDHGDMDTSHKLIFKGPFMYENMIHVPLIARIPKSYGGGVSRRVDSLISNVDLAPTLLDFAGAGDLECDGISLRPILSDRSHSSHREFVISQYYSKQNWINPIRTIRTRDWKYNLYRVHGEELYDLKNDPGEITNLASDVGYKSVREGLRAELDAWMKANDDPFNSYGISTREGVRRKG
jgi:arylsulfatase A-like enzyme